MSEKIKELHEKISDVYNTLWSAYKKSLKDGSAKHINDAAYVLEEKYRSDPTVLQFIWYQKASWSGIILRIREWS